MKTRNCTLSLMVALSDSWTMFAAAHADRTEDVPKVAVSYADLDLSKPTDAEVLYRRIQTAGRVVCQPLASRELMRRALWQTCYESAVENAVAQVNRPLVSAAHQRKVGKHADAIRSAQR